MKNKILRIFVIIVLIFGTLFVSNYFIDYYKLDSVTLDIISSLDEGLSTKSIISQGEMDEILDSTKTLNISSDDVDTYINDNSSLNFFTNTNKVIITYYYDSADDKLDFNVTTDGINNLASIDSLDEIQFNVNVDDYYVKRTYTFNYTEEEVKEFKKTLKEELQKANKDILDNFKEHGIETKINVQIVES